MNVDYNPWSVQKMNLNRELNIMEPLAELDGSMEPLQRARSNTWPLPRPDDYVEPDGGNGGNGGGGGIIGNKCPVGGLGVPPPSCIGGAGGGGSSSAAAKKNSSRRNAWGNFSYADLITQAITSSQDKRLTLSQIYEWMVQNVDYFKDKGDSNSSAGWKNSIRHNLSLHNRFMRVQNEGTGKSSWWMINPDAKPGKSVRRRAASMETSKFEKRRGRVKKKISDMRNGLTEATPSPSSSVSEGLDQFPDSPLPSGAGFQLSPDFRPRASSNTSSCGRLSPIHSVDVEPDWNTPNPYSTSATGGANTNGPSNYSPEMGGNYSPDQLAGNLEQGMKLQPEAYLGYMNGQTQQPPPPYSAPYESFNRRDQITSLHGSSPYGITQCPIHRLQNCGCGPVQCKVELMSPGGMSPSYPQSEPSPDPLSSQYHHNSNAMPRPPSSSPPLTPQPTGMTPSSVMLISGALNRPMISTAITSSMTLDDLNINIESLQGFDCNVDEVIKHELNMDGSLDFNFSSNHQILNQTTDSVTMVNNTQTVAPPAYSTTVTTPSWVH